MKRKQEKPIQKQISQLTTNSTLKQLINDLDKSKINKVTQKNNNSDQKVQVLNNKNITPNNDRLKKQPEINQYNQKSTFLVNQFIANEDIKNKKQGENNSNSKNKNKTSSNEKYKKVKVDSLPIEPTIENTKVTQLKHNKNAKDQSVDLPVSSASKSDQRIQNSQSEETKATQIQNQNPSESHLSQPKKQIKELSKHNQSKSKNGINPKRLKSTTKILNKDKKTNDNVTQKKIYTPVKEQKEKSIQLNREGARIKFKQVMKQNKILDQEKDTKTPQVTVSFAEPRFSVSSESPSCKQNISADDIKRIKFIKKLQAEKLSIQERLSQKKRKQEMALVKQEAERRKQEELVLLEQRQKKRKNIQYRLSEIERRKQQRRVELSKQNKQYQERKQDYTLQHKLVNQWLERETEENLRKEKQLEEKVSKMKPINFLKSIQEHNQMIESYKVLHHSHFMQEDLKYQQYKSRLQLEKLYKSQWYHQVRENDPLDIFNLQQQKQKEQKQILLMKLDNKKKYSEYVKVNYKPDSNEDSLFNYQKRIINHLPAHKIKRMGLDNLAYSKQHAQNSPQKQSKTQTQREKSQRRTDYLHQLKSTRQKRQSFSSEKNIYQMKTNTKSSNSLAKQQKVTKINLIQQEIQQKSQRKQMFNRKNNSQLKGVEIQKINSFLTRKSSSLPALNYKQLTQPKLKVISSLKGKNKVLNDLDGFLMEINQKFKILQKII